MTGMSDYKRLTIDIAPEVYEDLLRLADEQGCNVTELIKRSIALNRYVWEHKDAELVTLDQVSNEVSKIVLVGK